MRGQDGKRQSLSLVRRCGDTAPLPAGGRQTVSAARERDLLLGAEHLNTKRIKKAGEELPSSRYRFFDKQIEITYRPGKKDEETLDPLAYDKLIKLGEDADYFFLFPHSQGGYCIPKKALAGKENAFRDFVEQKTGQRFYRRRPSPLQRLMERMKKRENEPEHL